MSETTSDFRTFTRQVRLTSVLTARTALRVGAGRSYDVLGEDVPVVKDTLERPVIPGSSFKGAVRAYAEQVLRTLEPLTERSDDAPPLSCDPLVELCLSNEEVEAIKEEDRADEKLRERSCWACRLFGAPWMASRVLFKDLHVQGEAWFDQFSYREGVSIDRDKGTAQARKRYTLETVPEGTPFDIELIVDGATDAELGLLLLALEGINNGMVALGGARSRGLGDVSLEVAWSQVEEITPGNALDVLGARVLDQEPSKITWARDQRDAWIETLFHTIGLPEAELNRWQQARSQMEVTDGR
jgi:CRISPR-associated RAMP protein (TIGR02581 family)